MDTLSIEIEKVLSDVNSDNSSTRIKAVANLVKLLNGRLRTFLENRENPNNIFDQIFKGIENALQKHARKLCETNQEMQKTHHRYFSDSISILVNARNIFNDMSFVLIQIGNALKNEEELENVKDIYIFMLKSALINNDPEKFAFVKKNVWENLLASLLEMLLDKQRQNADNIIECVYQIVDLGCSYTQLSSELVKLKTFNSISQSLVIHNQNVELIEKLLVLSFKCCQNVAADYRFEMCRFTEIIYEDIYKVFETNLKSARKAILFKLLDMTIILHVPLINDDNSADIQYIFDTNKWKGILNVYERILNKELIQTYNWTRKEKKIPEINVSSITALAAARFCYYYYWNEEVTGINPNNDDSDSDTVASASKRKKSANKLQVVLDKIMTGGNVTKNFNWNWMMVFAELIYNFPMSLTNDDIHEVMVMLTECQPFIESRQQQYAFTMSCLVLLQKNEMFKIYGNKIVFDHCEKLWWNIAEEAVRVCTSASSNSVEAHGLIQLLMYYQKCNSSNLIDRIIKIFVMNSAVKCDYTLNTLIILLQSFNLDSVPNGKDLTLDILKYICKRSNSDLLKRVNALSDSLPTRKTIAKLAVMCCLLKTDMIKYLKKFKINEVKLLNRIHDTQDQSKYKDEVDKIIDLIRLKCLNKFLIENECKSHQSENHEIEKMEFVPTELKCIIDQQIYENLMDFTKFQTKNISESNSVYEIKSYLRDVMESNELYLNLASEFLKFEAYDKDKYNSSFITKKIKFNLQEINRLFMLLEPHYNRLDNDDNYIILILVQTLLEKSFHSEIGKLIRNYDLINCLKFVWSLAKKPEHVESQEGIKPKEPSQSFIEKATKKDKIPYIATITLCEYFNYEGLNTSQLERMICNEIIFDENNNMDVLTVLKICEIFGGQRNISLKLATWIWPNISNICVYRNNSNFIMKCIVDQLGNIINFSKEHECFSEYIIVIFTLLFKFCMSDQEEDIRSFNEYLAVKVIEKFELFHQVYFKYYFKDVKVQNTYNNFLSDLVPSMILEIRMASINTLKTILHYDIDLERSQNDEKILNQNLRKVYDILVDVVTPTLDGCDRNEVSYCNDIDMNTISFLLQLHISAICANSNKRNYHIMAISKIFYMFDIPEICRMSIISKMKNHLKCLRFYSIIDDYNDLIELIDSWFSFSDLLSFPWHFFQDSKNSINTINDFISEYYFVILISVMKTKIKFVPQLLEINENSPKILLEKILPDLLVYFIPIEAEITSRYKESAKDAYELLLTHISAEELKDSFKKCITNVIVLLLENVIDNNKIQKLCLIDPDFHTKKETITYEDFQKCLDFMSKRYGGSRNDNLLTKLCKTNLKSVQQIFLLLKKKIEKVELKEKKLLYLSQYYILIEEIYEYMNNPSIPLKDSIKPYMIREICYYFCYLISNDKDGQRLRHIAAKFLFDFLKNILPACVNEIKNQLHRIIPQLVSICLKSDKRTLELRPKCLEIIRFLILNYNELKDEIVKLDRFPSHKDFDEIRKKQIEIKYENGEYTLVEEIKVFLEGESVSRHADGIAALCEHITNKREELKKLFDEANNYEGDKENTLLHKLIRRLIYYATFNINQDENRALESIKCLGEIGVHNISSIVFNSEVVDDQMIYKRVTDLRQCQRIICEKILDRIEILLLHNNPLISQTASEACYELMGSESSVDYKPSIYLRPFIWEERSLMTIFYLKPKNDKDLELLRVIKEVENEDYIDFMKKMCESMVYFAGCKVIISLIENSLNLAEIVFPMVFQLLLLYNSQEVNNEILETLNYFFENVDEKLNFSEHTNRGSIFIDKGVIRQMLKLVDIIRVHCQDQSTSLMNKMKNLNYLYIAKAANYCDAYFSAIQYCEIWAQEQFDMKNIEFSISIKNTSLQQIMVQSYLAIGNHDGCDLFLNPATNRVLYLEQKGLLMQAILEVSDQPNMRPCLELLSKYGLYQLVYNYDKSMRDIDKAKRYECLWQLSNWDEVVETDTKIIDKRGTINYEAEYEKYHYLSLKCCRNDDELGMKESISKGRRAILMQISKQTFQCSHTLYKFLEMAQRLIQIEDFAKLRFKKNENSHIALLEKWKYHDKLPLNFEHYNRVLLQRNSIYSTANIQTGRRTWIPTAIQENLLFIAKQSIVHGHPSNAIKALAKIKMVEGLTFENKLEGLLEEAKLFMSTNTEMAKGCLKQILEDKQTENNFILKSHTNRLYGEILAESYSQDIAYIIKNYFYRAMAYLEQYARHYNRDHMIGKLDDNSDILSQPLSQATVKSDDINIEEKIRDASTIYDTIAKYYDRQYEDRVAYLSSEGFITKKKSFEDNKKRLEKMERDSNRNSTLDYRKLVVILKKSIALDKIEIEEAEKERKLAARNTVYFYIRSTINSPDESTFNIFRIIALMFVSANGKYVRSIIKDNLCRIPTFKFITALPQLTVRLNNCKKDELNCIIKDILERCANDHPHHTLPLILSLCNSYVDAEKKCIEEPRVIGAKKLWVHLLQKQKLHSTMMEMKNMSEALIDLANVESKSSSMPPNHAVTKLNHLKNIQCPTIELPISQNCDYSQIISVIKWEKQISNVGGINAPKKINVLCSDGITRPQLLKGKDDIRQDAIFQQIFSVVNKLLFLNDEMRKKRARIRTYKIVPFSRRSGILEWCCNTIPIGDYLCGSRENNKIVSKGAHVKYRPQDWPPHHCLQKISDVSSEHNDTKLNTFLEVCEHIKPVFHQFFNEHYKSPGSHFEHRLAYTISVAVSSMIGYILGIGDRHFQNILIDLKTAELIHIDFGVAFEQGKCLPHPELIPFRLTRDMIAPMGVSGVDGIFRKACEQTMDILCRNERTISTILEVLLYDPMYVWTVGAEAARRVQLGSDEVDTDDLNNKEDAENKHDSMATRALLRCQSKLKGVAESTNVTYPTIEGHVQYLIQSATNTAFLSRLFRGWQAYL